MFKIFTGIIGLKKSIIVNNETISSKTFHTILNSKPIDYDLKTNPNLTITWTKMPVILSLNTNSRNNYGYVKISFYDYKHNILINKPILIESIALNIYSKYYYTDNNGNIELTASTNGVYNWHIVFKGDDYYAKSYEYNESIQIITGIITENLKLTYSTNILTTKTFKGIINSNNYTTQTLLKIQWKYGTTLTATNNSTKKIIDIYLKDNLGNPISGKKLSYETETWINQRSIYTDDKGYYILYYSTENTLKPITITFTGDDTYWGTKVSL